MKDKKLVYIEWVDSYGCSPTWTPCDSIEADIMVCRSVGWLLYEDKDCKVIVPHLSSNKHGTIEIQGCGDMTIPNCVIKKIRKLN